MAGALIGASTSTGSGINLMGRNYHHYYHVVGGYNSLTGSGSGLYGAAFNNASGAQYGWIDLAVTDNGAGNAFTATLNGWGYETTVGASIAAGAVAAVPEPASLALMAMGLIGLGAAHRRQRRTTRAS